MKSMKLRTGYQQLELVTWNSDQYLGRVLPDSQLLIPRPAYFIRNGILAIFFSAIPVPLTTARSGSSATCTGSFIL